MIVYRVEDEHGQGPYRRGWVGCQEMQMAHNDDPLRPGPYEDGPELAQAYDRENYQDLKYGFRTLDLLDQWFEGWMHRLHAAGYRIATYIVPDEDVYQGHLQLAYLQEGAVPA